MTLFLKKIVLDDASDKIESRSFKDVRLGASVISEFCRRLLPRRPAGRERPSILPGVPEARCWVRQDRRCGEGLPGSGGLTPGSLTSCPV